MWYVLGILVDFRHGDELRSEMAAQPASLEEIAIEVSAAVFASRIFGAAGGAGRSPVRERCSFARR